MLTDIRKAIEKLNGAYDISQRGDGSKERIERLQTAKGDLETAIEHIRRAIRDIETRISKIESGVKR